jgi:N-acetylglucosamine malate deacetylase 1
MSNPVAFAVNAHPDDIEFMMAGTLVLLKEAGYGIHVMNVANGSCGTMDQPPEQIVAQRTREAREAANVLGATFHEPLVNDLDILYDQRLLKRLCAVIREIRPTIMLVPSPEDYMEDHVNACRLAVSAAFYRGMRNFVSDPPLAAIPGQVTLYHALPYGLRDPLRRRISPGLFVDISSVVAIKREALACHRSQKEWLDASQGLDSYLVTMEDMSREVGHMSGRYAYAEGWRRHLHLGFCGPDDDPLSEALGAKVYVVPESV